MLEVNQLYQISKSYLPYGFTIGLWDIETASATLLSKILAKEPFLFLDFKYYGPIQAYIVLYKDKIGVIFIDSENLEKIED